MSNGYNSYIGLIDTDCDTCKQQVEIKSAYIESGSFEGKCPKCKKNLSGRIG
jgi:phage FluMu protein Com